MWYYMSPELKYFFYFRVYIFIKNRISTSTEISDERYQFSILPVILEENLKHGDLYSFVNLFNRP